MVVVVGGGFLWVDYFYIGFVNDPCDPDVALTYTHSDTQNRPSDIQLSPRCTNTSKKSIGGPRGGMHFRYGFGTQEKARFWIVHNHKVELGGVAGGVVVSAREKNLSGGIILHRVCK